MQYDHILVRFGELTTKGKNRKVFIGKLVQNVRLALKEFEHLEYQRTYDRLYILLHDEDQDAVIEKLKKVFGIHSFSLAIKVDTDLEEIKKAAAYLIENHEGNTFKIDTKRNDKSFPMMSQDINRVIAGHVFNHVHKPLKVDVHHPDLLIKIELRHDSTYIMNDVVMGAGGYPVGIGGKALLMLSGGIDSPVAGYLTLKRGVEIECIHFSSPPYTSERARDKVLRLVEKLTDYSPKIKVHIVPFTDLQLAIYDHCDESYAMTIMRRMMYRVAEGVAKKNHCLVLANGESIGQVASQTLESMNVINQVTRMPVIRPVVCMDKLEIIDTAKKIDTYDISIEPYEDCCTIFTPKQPATKPKQYKVDQYEADFDFMPLVEACIEGIETIVVTKKQEQADEDLF